MDPRLEKALEFANYNLSLERERNQAREDFITKNVIYKNKGTFSVTVDLISFCKLLVDTGNIEDIVLLDDNKDPILIENLPDFYKELLQKYFYHANEYYNTYSTLSKKRSVKDIIFDE